MVDLTAPPERTCEVEKLKDAVFISSFKLHTVAPARDIFLLRTRKALQEMPVIRTGLVIESFCEALCALVVSCSRIGMGRMLDPKALAHILRRVSCKIAIKAAEVERGL
jgi:hypothetical protein